MKMKKILLAMSLAAVASVPAAASAADLTAAPDAEITLSTTVTRTVPNDEAVLTLAVTRQAQRAQGFGMKVLAHDPFWDEAYAKTHGITRAAPDEIFAECDVISLHLPLTPETENFIGAAELAKMKPDAILINTARGGLIDENALLDALEAGRLCGAGIDAFSSEPPKDARWFTLDNVVLGSHCAASTAGASRNMGRMATANLIHDLGL